MTGSGPIEVIDERRTNRWVGLAGATLLAAVLAVLVRSPGLMLVAGLGATLVAYASVVSPPAVRIAVDRSFEPVDPAVGESVTVELTIANRGDRTLPDVRVADGVPDGVTVLAGDPRCVTALRPGVATTIEYEIAGGHARRSFAPAHVAVRDVVGLVERRARIEAGTDTVAWPTIEPDAALALLPPEFGPVGPLATDDGGDGVAFHSVREHHSGDPLGRIDWRRRAKTGELATVEFRQEQVARVVLVVDARPAAAVAPSATGHSAIDRSLTAASALAEGIEAAGHGVGLAALGPADTWIEPDRGTVHRERLQRRLADASAFKPWRATVGTDQGAAASGDEAATRRDDASAQPPTAADGGGGHLDGLLARLDLDTSVVFLSPLHDGASEAAVRRLAARTRSVTVVSPDPTAAGTPGQRLAALERGERLRTLRSTGVSVVDWPADVGLERALAGLEGRS